MAFREATSALAFSKLVFICTYVVVAHRAKDEEELEKQAGQSILSMASGETKGPSRVPPYYGSEGEHSAQIWITGLEKLQGVQKWSDKQTLDAADIALFGIAAKWKVAQMEANTEVFQDLKSFLRLLLLSTLLFSSLLLNL